MTDYSALADCENCSFGHSLDSIFVFVEVFGNKADTDATHFTSLILGLKYRERGFLQKIAANSKLLALQ